MAPGNFPGVCEKRKLSRQTTPIPIFHHPTPQNSPTPTPLVVLVNVKHHFLPIKAVFVCQTISPFCQVCFWMTTLFLSYKGCFCMLNCIMLSQGLYTAWKCSVGGLWRLWLANGSDCPWRRTLIGQKTLPIVQYEWLSTEKAYDWSKDVVHCVVCSGCYRNVFKQWNTKKCLFPPKIPALRKSNPRQDAPRPWKYA